MGIIKLLRRGLIIAALVYGATLAGVVWFAATFENANVPPDVDMIVCLSAGVSEDGEIDLASQKRAEACAALFTAGAAPKVLFTGGNDYAGAPSASRGMAAWAHDRGVPSDVILLEENSHSTLQNALFSAPFIPADTQIVIVTEGFHLPRSKASFIAMGMSQSTLWMSVPFRRNADGSVNWHMLHREALAVWFNIGRYALWRTAKTVGARDIDHWLA